MFKTRDGHRYSQLGPKERFLRVVAYRQFTRMIHGKLKDRRIPLPACAYTAIHLTHNNKNGDEFEGYDDLETDDENL
ncbi:Hypothetical predicted protein [Paramuricea clavata]|uniref:Uncharacterized protein n=1 Tax=Paramuricea clavata TaxID=317549 RepID=A0A7D9F1E2_PARCT|nr:Hypothetical predicted protein [Paramuricea clavata]